MPYGEISLGTGHLQRLWKHNLWQFSKFNWQKSEQDLRLTSKVDLPCGGGWPSPHVPVSFL